MQTFLVGGAVRDALLGISNAQSDRDFVVVGATVEAMLAQGFKQVGRDFPVFLHPHTQEEHALARTERKSGKGYTGFTVHASPQITLEQDLERRDFTINAIAQDADGHYIDPFHGRADIEARVLRHVSVAFAEDPLRVLRAARFMARFAPLGFRVAPETVALMREMSARGELEHLVPERVWQEMQRALASAAPDAFIRTLRESDALRVVLPEVDALYGVPQRAEYHPEVDTGLHTELVLQQAAQIAPGDDRVGFAALVHDLGKAVTPKDELPKHIMHEQRGVPLVNAVCERLRVPLRHRQLALSVCKEHLNVHRIFELKDSTVLELLERNDAFRDPERIDALATTCEADKRGRAGLHAAPYPSADELRRLFAVAAAVRASDVAPGLSGPAVGAALRKARIQAIHQARAA